MNIRLIPNPELDMILPLVEILNPKVRPALLKARLDEMKTQDYRCVGVFDGEKLIAVSGLWINTRLYCGKMAEPDNVVIHPDYRSHGVGKRLMDWIYEYSRELGCDVLELNAYTTSERAHKFWFNQGFKILGFHFTRAVK